MKRISPNIDNLIIEILTPLLHVQRSEETQVSAPAKFQKQLAAGKRPRLIYWYKQSFYQFWYTFASQKYTSVWQSEVNRILMRTSIAWGGATSTSSITSGFPASHATAATPKINKIIIKEIILHLIKTASDASTINSNKTNY